MKKTALLLALMMVFSLAAGCGGKTNNNDAAGSNSPSASAPETTAPADPSNEASGYADGIYYAEGEFAEKSGWKEIVALRVEGGKIISVNWNGLSKNGGMDKKSSSEQGKYGMVANGKAQAEWHEQAAKMEQYVIEQQSTESLETDAEGKTDAVSGVSIGVGEFSDLVNKALKAGPASAGPYKDGNYFAEAPEFDANSGWKENVHVTVINGNIVAVSWNGTHKDGGTDKVTRSASGEYGMVDKGNAQAEWHEQALKAEAYLMEKQDPAAVPYNEADGKTDAISGVSIHVNGFVELAAQALKDAKS